MSSNLEFNTDPQAQGDLPPGGGTTGNSAGSDNPFLDFDADMPPSVAAPAQAESAPEGAVSDDDIDLSEYGDTGDEFSRLDWRADAPSTAEAPGSIERAAEADMGNEAPGGGALMTDPESLGDPSDVTLAETELDPWSESESVDVPDNDAPWPPGPDAGFQEPQIASESGVESESEPEVEEADDVEPAPSKVKQYLPYVLGGVLMLGLAGYQQMQKQLGDVQPVASAEVDPMPQQVVAEPAVAPAPVPVPGAGELSEPAPIPVEDAPVDTFASAEDSTLAPAQVQRDPAVSAGSEPPAVTNAALADEALAELRDEVAALRDTIASLNGEVDELKGERNGLERQVGQLSAEIKSLKAEPKKADPVPSARSAAAANPARQPAAAAAIRYLGSYPARNGGWEAFVLIGNVTHSVQTGDRIGQYRIDAVTQGSVKINGERYGARS